MMNIVVSILSFFQFLVINLTEKFNIFKVYNDDVNAECEELIDQYYGYDIIKTEKNYKIKGDNIEFVTQNLPKLIMFNDDLFIIYLDGETLNGHIIDVNGNEKGKIFAVLEGITNNYQLEVFNDTVYLVAEHIGNSIFFDKELDKSNILLYDIISDELKIYGGLANEKYLDSVTIKDKMYILLEKDKICYGDFGNAGLYENNICITEIGDGLNIIQNIVYDINEKAISLEDGYDCLFLKTEDKIYLINDKLKIIKLMNSHELGNFIITDKYLASFYDEKMIIYDSKNLERIYEEEYRINGELKIFNNNISIKENVYYDVDVIDTSKFKCFENYYRDIDDKNTLNTILGKAKLISNESKEFFDETTFGEYTFTLNYENINGVPFEIELQQKIPLKTNIENQMVYPSGYRIISNGIIYVNDQIFINNSAIYNPGEYDIRICGKNCEEEMTIYIDEAVQEYSDEIYDEYNYIYNINEKKNISFVMNYDVEITNIKSNYDVKEIKKIKTGNNIKVEIEVDGINDLGIYNIYLEELEYVVNNQVFTKEINRVYSILVVEDPLMINVEEFDKNDLYFKLNTSNSKLIRGIELIINKNNVNISSQKMLFSENTRYINLFLQNEGTYLVECNLFFYDGASYKYQKMCEIVIDSPQTNIVLGEMYKVGVDDNEILNINFSKSKKMIKKIIAGEKNIYISKKTTSLKHYVLGIVLLCAFFIIIRYIRKRKLEKLKI